MHPLGPKCNKLQDRCGAAALEMRHWERSGMWILGCGYIGLKLAQAYREKGQHITAVTRSEVSRQALAAMGFDVLVRDLTRASLDDLDWAGQDLFHLAPPPAEGAEDGLTRHLVASFPRTGHPRRLVYVSTTGVYGDCGGEWVDESRPPAPVAGRSLRRWDAEQTLLAWSQQSGAEVVILRVAGIYGPGRLPLERIRQGLPLPREEEAPWSNRVHADDMVQACMAAMERGRAGGIYNVCDDQPSTMTDYFLRLADAAALPRPPQLPLTEISGQVSAGMLSYLAESRRLSNRRMKEELGVRLLYPDLSTGLMACFQAGSH